MPAATSHEDIYQTSSSCFSSSYSSTASSPEFSYLPDYMMFMDGQSNESQQRHHPIKNTNLTRQQQQQQQQQRHLSYSQNQKLHQHQLYQKHSQQVATTQQGHHISYQWQSQPYNLANTYAGRHRDADIEPVMVICEDDDHQQANNSKQSSNSSYNALFSSQDLVSSGDCFSLSMTPPTQHYLTIEELRLARNSCWLCGCNWQQDHVSLDCSECGGYALTRPCPSCDGDCKQIWKRNINETHDSHKAQWVGQCNKHPANNSENGEAHFSKTNCGVGAAGQQKSRIITSATSDQLIVGPLASSCCSSHPSSAASSDSESECIQATMAKQNESKPTNEPSQQQHPHPRPTTSPLCIYN